MNKENTLKEAVLWIKEIFESLDIRYQISGGFAAHIYGSPRDVNDIDISIPEEDFPKLYEKVKDYVIEGPHRYKDEKWDLYAMVLDYKGQEIDIGGASTTKITSKDPETNEDTDEWMSIPTDFSKTNFLEWKGIKLPVEDRESLAKYKRHLNGDHQKLDITYLMK